jgi:hypothetical protein
MSRIGLSFEEKSKSESWVFVCDLLTINGLSSKTQKSRLSTEASDPGAAGGCDIDLRVMMKARRAKSDSLQ